ALSADPLYTGMKPADVAVVNHDDQDGSTVVLELVTDRGIIEQGSPVGYRLSVRNRGSQPIDALTIALALPPRFALLKGTLVRNGRPIADPAAGLTQELSLARLDGFVDRDGDGIAGPGEPGYAEFRWQLVPGAAATPGVYPSRASATA